MSELHVSARSGHIQALNSVQNLETEDGGLCNM
jgi:hypothetical protein